MAEKTKIYRGPVEILDENISVPSHGKLKRGMIVHLPDQFTYTLINEGKVKPAPDKPVTSDATKPSPVRQAKAPAKSEA